MMGSCLESLKEKQNLRAYTKIYEHLSGVTLRGFRDLHQLHSIAEIALARENSRFSLLLAPGEVSRETGLQRRGARGKGCFRRLKSRRNHCSYVQTESLSGAKTSRYSGVCYTAVFSVVTQRSCVTTLKTAV